MRIHDNYLLTIIFYAKKNKKNPCRKSICTERERESIFAVVYNTCIYITSIFPVPILPREGRGNFLVNHFSDIRIKWKLQEVGSSYDLARLSVFLPVPFLTQEILDTRHVFSFNAKLIALYLIGCKLFATDLHISLSLSFSNTINRWPSVPYWTNRFLTHGIYCCLPLNGNENIVEMNTEVRYTSDAIEIAHWNARNLCELLITYVNYYSKQIILGL